MANALLGTGTDATSSSERLTKILTETGEKLLPREALAPAPTPQPLPLPAKPNFGPEARVETLPLSFGVIVGMAMDNSVTPPELYVSDAASQTVRRFTFDGAGEPEEAGSYPVDGETGVGRLASDGRGALYVGSSNTIMRLSIRQEDRGAVTRLTAGGTGFQDGPGAAARFDNILGMAVEPTSGDLFIADRENKCIRRLATGQPGFPVTTVMGTGFEFHVDGPMGPRPGGTVAAPVHPGSSFSFLSDLAFTADGSLYTLDGQGIVNVVPAPLRPETWARRVAGGGSIREGDQFFHNGNIDAPNAIAVLPDGNLVVTEQGNKRVSLVTPDGWLHPLARVEKPVQLAVAKDGTIFVNDSDVKIVRIRR
jgi:hypothetical protein